MQFLKNSHTFDNIENSMAKSGDSMRFLIGLLICTFAFAGTAHAQSIPSPTAGYKAFEKRDFKVAVPLLEKECKANNFSSCTHLGLTYSDSISGFYNTDKAPPLYQKACDGKFYMACTELAFSYEIGSGIDADNDKALEYYDLACENGEGDACYYYAQLHETIDEYDIDLDLLAKYYEASCKFNYGEGCYWWGTHLENGWGTISDWDAALNAYQKAINLGYDEAEGDFEKLKKTIDEYNKKMGL